MADVQAIKTKILEMKKLRDEQDKLLNQLMKHCYLAEYHDVEFDQAMVIHVNKQSWSISYKTEDMEKFKNHRLKPPTILHKTGYICLL